MAELIHTHVVSDGVLIVVLVLSTGDVRVYGGLVILILSTGDVGIDSSLLPPQQAILTFSTSSATLARTLELNWSPTYVAEIFHNSIPIPPLGSSL